MNEIIPISNQESDTIINQIVSHFSRSWPFAVNDFTLTTEQVLEGTLCH